MPKTMLTFDYGASSGRGIIGKYDGDKISLSEIHRFSNDPVFVCGHLHWDFLRLFHEMKAGMIKASVAGYKDISSVGVDTWGVDFGLLDKNGMLVGNPFHYRDTLTENEFEEVFKKIPGEQLYARTGIQFLRFNTLFQLHALKRLYPDMYDRAADLLMAPDLLNFLLSGVKSAEYTIASTTQMYNLENQDWDFKLLDVLSLDAGMLQKITPPATVLGPVLAPVADETGISCDVISVCGHDTGSAYLAVPVVKGERAAVLSCGTWSLLGVELDKPLATPEAYAIDYTNEGGMGKTTRFLKNIMGLWIYQEVKREYERREGEIDYKTLDTMVMSAEPFVSLIDPDDDRFMLPGKMIEKINDFCRETNQPVPKDLGAVLRCALESLALKYRYSISGLENVVGGRLPALRVVGGGCKDKILMRFTACALARPVFAGPVEATAIGNLAAQLIAAGEATDMWQAREIISRSESIIKYEPENVSSWDDAYANFIKLIK